MGDWDGVRLWGGGDAAQVRARLSAGADPCELFGGGFQTMLHSAAGVASPVVVEAMAGAARTLDLLVDGRSALWIAVHEGRHDNARVLAAAGAAPWLTMMAGWSPGRLSLAGPEPQLFADRPPDVSLTQRETESVATARLLRTALADFYLEGTGLLCVAGIDTAEAIRRLDGVPMSQRDLLAHYEVEVDEDFEDEDDWRWLYDTNDLLLVGITDVPGGCIVTQPWGYQPQAPAVSQALSVGTTAYGVYANPKSGNQGSVVTDGQIEGWDLHPGGSPPANATSDEVLLSYLYKHNPAAYACAYVGLRPPSARSITGPPDAWVLLPE
jgi:hypothetical protein